MADIFAIKRPDGSIEARCCGYNDREAWFLYKYQVVECWRYGCVEEFAEAKKAEGYSVVRVKIEEVE
jgi:hypothetical protein